MATRPPRTTPTVPPPPKVEEKQTALLTTPALIEALRQFGQWHGRALTREIEIACEVHVTRSMVNALNWPAFRQELERDRPELDLDAFRAEQEAHLRALEEYSLSRPPHLDRVVELEP